MPSGSGGRQTSRCRPGHAAVQLGGDPANCDLENLACVPRVVLRILNFHCGSKSGRPVIPSRARIAQLGWMLKRRAS